MNYKIYNINWIDVILAPMKDTYSTTIQILVKAGSVFETKENNGISHFLEHMFFKGWERYPDAKSVSKAIDRIGGEFNAFTGKQRVGYYVKTNKNHTSKAIDVLSDMMVNAKFPKNEIEKERWVILQELKMYEDSPQKDIYDKFRRYYYGDNNYGWTTLGTIDNINSISQQNFFDYKNKLYTKQNMVIVVSWDLPNEDEIKEDIKNKFQNLLDWENKSIPKKPNYKPNIKLKSIDKDTQQNHLILWAPWFDKNDSRRYAASILATILGWNMSSKLFQAIREDKGLCYYIIGSHNASINDGLFWIKTWLQKDKFQEWLKEIYNQVQSMSKWKFTKQDYEDALGYVIGNMQISTETSDDVAGFLWNQYLLKWEIKTIDQIISNYQNVNFQDIKDIAAYLNKSNWYGCYIK